MNLLEEHSNFEGSGSGIIQVSGRDVLFSRLGKLGKLWNASHFSGIADSVQKELEKGGQDGLDIPCSGGLKLGTCATRILARAYVRKTSMWQLPHLQEWADSRMTQRTGIDIITGVRS